MTVATSTEVTVSPGQAVGLWDFGTLYSFLILSSSRATSFYAVSRHMSLHLGSSLPLSLVPGFPRGPHTSEGPEALCYVDVSFSMVLS